MYRPPAAAPQEPRAPSQTPRRPQPRAAARVWRLTLALDAAEQGIAADGSNVVLVLLLLIIIIVLRLRRIRLPHRLHVHHEAVAVQPRQLRQLATCDHHLPWPASLVQALHVQVGDAVHACGRRLPLAAAQPDPQPVAQLAAHVGAPRHANRLELAKSRSVHLLKHGFEHVLGRQ